MTYSNSEEQVKPYLNIEGQSHKTAAEGMCVMEAVAYFVGERHSDKPECTCPLIRKAMIIFNDRFPFKNNAERTKTLLPLIPVVVGTRGTVEDIQQRRYIMADYACRVFLPIALKARGRNKEADACKALAKVVDKETAIAARDLARKVRADADAAAVADVYAVAVAVADAAAAAAAYADAVADADAAASAVADAYAAVAAAAVAYAAAAAAAAAAAVAAAAKEAIKLAFTEMIKDCANVGRKAMTMTPEAFAEYQGALKCVGAM